MIGRVTAMGTPPRWLAAAALMLACTAAVAAQPAAQKQQQQQQQQPNALQGFSTDSSQPVKITANTLEVRDKIQQATFSGDVKLVQGDTTITCRTLVVFYDQPTQGAKPGAKKGAAPPAQAQKAATASPPTQTQQIKRAECKGDVLIVQKDQTASGEVGVFEVKSNTVTITGGVVVTQGQKVMRGDRVVTNLTTGVTTVDASKSNGRVELMLPPSAPPATPSTPSTPSTPAAPPPAPAAKSPPKGPIRIN